MARQFSPSWMGSWNLPLALMLMDTDSITEGSDGNRRPRRSDVSRRKEK